MGGAKDSILPTTSKVILEIANFQAAGIRRTALRYDNRTEASARYEKAIDPERCDQALRSVHAAVPGAVSRDAGDGAGGPVPRAAEAGGDRRSPQLAGAPSGQGADAGRRGRRSWSRWAIQLSFDGDNMHVVVPTWRSTGDVSIKADIMEEVARMYGYENFEAEPITTSFDGAINQLDKDLERHIKEYLAVRCGMQEIFSYPWMEEQLCQRHPPEHRRHPGPVHTAVPRGALHPRLPAAQPVQGGGQERALLRRFRHLRDGAGVPR